MAPKKGRENALEICSNTTASGNTISIRMVEYLSTGKTETHNFRQLAIDFLDTCHILWSIQIGLSEVSHRDSRCPIELLDDLGKKIRLVGDDFIVLNQMLAKFLEGERKGGFRRGWRRMFADGEIDNMRRSLAKNREALRMSSLMFRWSVGEQTADTSMGIGYTALSAALEYDNNRDRPQVGTPPVQHFAPAVTPPVTSAPPMLPLPSPPEPLMGRTFTPTNSLTSRSDSPLALSNGRQSMGSGHHSQSSKATTVSTPPLPRKDVISMADVANLDDVSEATVAMTAIEDMIHDMDYRDKMPVIQELELNDAASNHVLPRFPNRTVHNNVTLRQSPSGDTPAAKAALKIAIQQNKHKLLEQLLNHGGSADEGEDVDNLRLAIAKRDPESVRLLLQHGADPNAIDKDGLTPLHMATDSSFLGAAKLLIDYGADPNFSTSQDGQSPLAMSVNGNKIDFVQLYLHHGGIIDSSVADGDTILIRAMNKSTPAALIELMLKHGTDPNGKNGEGTSPLFAAIQAKRVDLVTLLLEGGANPNLPGPKHPLWPSTYQPAVLQVMLSHGADYKKCPGVMELATSLNNRESVSILLEAGVDPNARKDGTYTPLCTAIRDNRGEIVSLLLANGADPNVMASEYPAFKCVTHHRTHFLPQLIASGADLSRPKGIIEKAVAHNNKDALMWLLKQGVNPNDRSPEGHTALTTAIRNDKIEFIDILLAHGANPAVRGQEWPISMSVKRPAILAKLLPHISDTRTIPKGVLEQAVVANELESIKLLLQAGVSVEDKTGGVFSPLTTAIRERRKEIVLYLLDEAGADVNAPGEHLPIIKAIRRCENRDHEVIEMLLDRGADINLIYRGWNAVLQAVDNGDADILNLLVEKGGDVDLEAQDVDGTTVIDLVQGRSWQEGVDILLGNKAEALDNHAK